jgi:hypothetical protein
MENTQRKPFDLAKALDGAPVVNGYGTPVTLTKLAIPSADFVVLSQDSSGGVLAYHRADGTTGGPPSTKYTLFMAPVEKTVWLNLYPLHSVTSHKTEELADRMVMLRSSERIGGKAHPLTYTE